MPLPLFWSRILPFWRRAEIRAASYLRSLGFRVVASGFRVKEGEVDLIAWERDLLVFVEVKSRLGSDPPEAAVGFAKKRRIARAARAYIARHKLQGVTHRFDIVTVNDVPGQPAVFRLIRDAFRPPY